MRVAAAAVCLLLALTGCKRAEHREGAVNAPAALAAPVGFQHEPGFDAQGYYRPEQAVGPGPVKLATIAVGAPSDFDAWESGKREEVFGPVVLIFEDPASALDEAGRRKGRIEVKPLAYMLSPGRLAFHGKDAQLGEVDFDGAFDTAALAGARAGGTEARPVLSGQLAIAGQKAAAVRFGYQAGD